MWCWDVQCSVGKGMRSVQQPCPTDGLFAVAAHMAAVRRGKHVVLGGAGMCKHSVGEG